MAISTSTHPSLKDLRDLYYDVGADDCPKHQWAQPVEVVGGCAENPGFVGRPNGAMMMREVCAHCGVGRKTLKEANGKEHVIFTRPGAAAMSWVTRRWAQ